MTDEITYLKSIFHVKDNELDNFEELILVLGIDKTLEIANNYLKYSSRKDNLVYRDLNAFAQYEYVLSSILFSILRVQEDSVKGVLSNIFNNVKLNIESKPSNFTKTKYYFRFPSAKDEVLLIRTFSFTQGPVDYYDAIKTLDFGDINLVFSHLPSDVIKRCSNNPNVLEDLDKTRQLRNYVYHHNILFSLGKDKLKELIILVMKNLAFDNFKEFYIKEINNARFEGGNNYSDIGEDIAINIDEKDRKEIFMYSDENEKK